LVATDVDRVNSAGKGEKEGEKQYEQVVPDDTQAEDGHGETVAAPVRLVKRQLGEDLVLVLCLRGNKGEWGERRATMSREELDGPWRATMFQKRGFCVVQGQLQSL
jgi:hypothetical protein